MTKPPQTVEELFATIMPPSELTAVEWLDVLRVTELTPMAAEHLILNPPGCYPYEQIDGVAITLDDFKTAIERLRLNPHCVHVADEYRPPTAPLTGRAKPVNHEDDFEHPTFGVLVILYVVLFIATVFDFIAGPLRWRRRIKAWSARP